MKTNNQSHKNNQLPTAIKQQPPGRKHLIMKKAKSLLAKLLIICLLAPLAPSVNKPHLATQASTAYPPSAWGSVTDFPDADAYGGLLSLYTLSVGGADHLLGTRADGMRMYYEDDPGHI